MDPTASTSITTEQSHGIEKKRSSASTVSSVTSAARSIASVFSNSVPGDITEHELQDYPHTGRSSLQTDAATLRVMGGGGGGNTGATTPVYRDSSDSDSTLTESSTQSHEGPAPPLDGQQQQEEQELEPDEAVLEQESWLKAFWGDNISVVVPFKNARDHLALERTYLSYHRTAMVFAMLSVVTAQLTVINHAPNPSPTFGFRKIGKPLSVVLACCALIISTIGVLRWWRLQNGLLRGMAISGGGELVVVGAIVSAVIAGTLGLVIAIDITKEY